MNRKNKDEKYVVICIITLLKEFLDLFKTRYST